MYTYTIAALAAHAVAQEVAVPAEYYSGFNSVSTFSSVGGKATCVQGMVPGMPFTP